jgi:hypothetical protein
MIKQEGNYIPINYTNKTILQKKDFERDLDANDIKNNLSLKIKPIVTETLKNKK